MKYEKPRTKTSKKIIIVKIIVSFLFVYFNSFFSILFYYKSISLYSFNKLFPKFFSQISDINIYSFSINEIVVMFSPNSLVNIFPA